MNLLGRESAEGIKPSETKFGTADRIAVERRVWRRRLRRQVLPRLLGDLIAVVCGLVVYFAATGKSNLLEWLSALSYLLVAFAVDGTVVRRRWGIIEELVLALRAALTALALTATVGLLLGVALSRILVFTVAASLILVRPLIALLTRRILAPTEVNDEGTLVLCTDLEYEALTSALTERPATGLGRVTRLQGDETPPTGASSRFEASELLRHCITERPSQLVVGAASWADRTVVEDLVEANELGVEVRSLPRFFEEEFGRVPLVSLDTSWFLFDMGPLQHLGYRVLRRVVDLLAALVASVALLFLLPLVLAANGTVAPGPVFYRQERTGQHGESFVMLKLRTMREDAEADGTPRFAGTRDHRVTQVGRFLRRARLDELPQCINLFRGEMSLIGPRPERPQFVARYRRDIPFFDKRHMVKPGLTGWAQVQEGYTSSDAETARKLERDLYYIKHQSLGLDLRVLALTALSMIQFKGR